METILALAAQYDLKIIEDAAEVIGQTCNNRPCGSFGEIGAFSFYPNKHVPTAAYQFAPALISNSLTSGWFIRVANTKAVLPLLS